MKSSSVRNLKDTEPISGAFYEFLDEWMSMNMHGAIDDLYQDFSEYKNWYSYPHRPCLQEPDDQYMPYVHESDEYDLFLYDIRKERQKFKVQSSKLKECIVSVFLNFLLVTFYL